MEALFDCIQGSAEKGFVLLAAGLSDEQAVADLHNNPDQRHNADEEHEAFDDHIGHLLCFVLKKGRSCN